MRKIKSLESWDWCSLIAALRYYERRSTITAAMFPGDVVTRFWGSGKYADSVLTQIANQFARIDHGLDGEEFWSEDKTCYACDKKVWCKFYAFCKAWCIGFSTVMIDRTENGRQLHDERKCFYCDFTKRWYPVDEYVASPNLEAYCPEEFITKVVHSWVES